MTSGNSNTVHHLAVVVFLAYGHVRPLSIWTTRVVKLRSDVCITFFTSQIMYDRVVAEIASNFSDAERDVQARIRVVAMYHDPMAPWIVEEVDKAFAVQLKNLVEGKPLHCERNGDTIPGVVPPGPPTVLVVDVYGYDGLAVGRKLSKVPLKVYALGPATLIGLYPALGPFNENSKGELRRKAKALEETGMSALEAAWRVAVPGFTDKVFSVPGMPDVHEYELTPQRVPGSNDGPTVVGLSTTSANDLYHEADGLLTVAYDCFEPPETKAAMEAFFALTSRKMYAVGPLVSSGKTAAKKDLKGSAKSEELMEFMDGVLKSHGEKSLVYIGFGSVFFPADVEKLVVFLDTLVEQRRPFILCHGGMFAAAVPDGIRLLDEKIRASGGLGFMTPWTPQRTILQHPATGWFVTHCGVNGLTESITAGVPMIAWPFMADQPHNAIRMTDQLNIAYELYEVRSEHALKPILRNGKTPTGTAAAIKEETLRVLANAFGEDGKKKRENVLRLKEACAAAWEEGGSGRTATERFLEDAFD